MNHSYHLFFIISLLSINVTFAQQQLPEYNITSQEVEAQMRFLASDALKGRLTGEEGNRIAAAYIATQLEAYGVKKVENMATYYQPVNLQQVVPISQASLDWNKTTFQQGKNLMMLSGEGGSIKAKAVFVGDGWVDQEKGIDDYAGLDVEGKIVITNIGLPDSRAPLAIIKSMQRKREIAEEKGAVAVIELFQLGSNYWNIITKYFSKSSIQLSSEERKMNSKIPYGWILEEDTSFSSTIKEGKKTKIKLSNNASEERTIQSDNVIGVIEGNDTKLKNEYVVITAHYDHVGVGEQGGGAYTEQDSIFNGARDNAFGTVALLSTAKALAAAPPKRSILILAVTGEEKGLLGSSYYSDHPVIPLEKTIFNFNTDGAGYNSKDRVTIFGLGRTGVDEELNSGAAEFGLKVSDDPAPEQGLYDRSDNVSFAAKGVPAITFSPGFTAFDEEIMKNYHQVSDNPETIDFDYLATYCKIFAHTTRLIANKSERPFWKEGDKYEEAGKALYKK